MLEQSASESRRLVKASLKKERVRRKEQCLVLEEKLKCDVEKSMKGMVHEKVRERWRRQLVLLV